MLDDVLSAVVGGVASVACGSVVVAELLVSSVLHAAAMVATASSTTPRMTSDRWAGRALPAKRSLPVSVSPVRLIIRSIVHVFSFCYQRLVVRPGDRVIVAMGVSTDDAKERFDNVEEVKPYLPSPLPRERNRRKRADPRLVR